MYEKDRTRSPRTIIKSSSGTVFSTSVPELHSVVRTEQLVSLDCPLFGRIWLVKGVSRIAVRSTLHKAYEIKYPTARETRSVVGRCPRSKSAVFIGLSAGIHELCKGGGFDATGNRSGKIVGRLWGHTCFSKS